MTQLIKRGKYKGVLVAPGQVFYRLTVTAMAPQNLAVCRCSCGSQVTVKRYNLACGATKNCGCYNRERTRLAARPRKPLGSSVMSWLYNSYGYNARRRNLDFRLSKPRFAKLTSAPCAYCGKPPAQKAAIKARPRAGTYYYNGLDRLDNARGYVEDNVVPCCGQCNHAKGTLAARQFIEWAASVARWTSNKDACRLFRPTNALRS